MGIALVVKCSVCGASFVARRPNRDNVYVCKRSSCRAKAAALRRGMDRKESPDYLKLDVAIANNIGALTVVFDPLDKGGWKPGKQFSRDEWKRMYEYLTFTHGTILRDRHGHLYRADGSAAL